MSHIYDERPQESLNDLFRAVVNGDKDAAFDALQQLVEDRRAWGASFPAPLVTEALGQPEVQAIHPAY